jgi:hypothetical protein
MKFNYHKDGTSPKDKDVIFVFGSNLSGIHGAGAAKEARANFGAVWREYLGFTGNSYAIPTVNKNISGKINLEKIEKYINDFVDATHEHKDKKFFVTRVGCGLAGYSNEDIAPLFSGCNPENCTFPDTWAEYLE